MKADDRLGIEVVLVLAWLHGLGFDEETSP